MSRFGNIYTIHTNAEAKDPSQRIELVREGFSIWAFVFHAAWLFYNRLWIPFFIYLMLVVCIVEGGERMDWSEATIAILQVGLQVLLAVSAHDIQRWALGRRGYVLTGVSIGESELRASQRAYDRMGA